jgi:hypothetical protein
VAEVDQLQQQQSKHNHGIHFCIFFHQIHYAWLNLGKLIFLSYFLHKWDVFQHHDGYFQMFCAFFTTIDQTILDFHNRDLFVHV